MPITYDNIATTTLSSATASITFSSIPATYTDLKVVLVGTFSSVSYFEITFNGTTSGYSWTYLNGDGSTATSGRISSNTKWVPNFPTGAGSTTIPMLSITDIFSYAGSTFKTGLMETSADLNGSGQVIRSVGLWQNTAAITSIKLEVQTHNWNIGTIATLYGIKNA
jgi:hypothetical protein